ncbi:MAG: 4a-hydroxytetrahydrobiopterin dehydratase [Chthoniobacterales bacterium]|nr:4a-hydroxytetrahydrobiopterin dehydratase [Chthoniobacterales bacterium]
MNALLSGGAIREALARLPGWTLEGGEIVRTFAFADFAAALGFVNRAGTLAEQANHHPDIDIRWNKVTLRLTTHSKGGLTALDFGLAEEIDRLARELREDHS